MIAAAQETGNPVPLPPRSTAYGSLLNHLQDQTDRDFAPMNINWGILPDPEEPVRDKGVKREMKIAAANVAFAEYMASL
jgi:methylenetetrahydrofolate--tRNA-(uracil-5-)-methyltransferase